MAIHYVQPSAERNCYREHSPSEHMIKRCAIAQREDECMHILNNIPPPETGNIMNKYQTALHYDESTSKLKKTANKETRDGQTDIVEKLDYPARQPAISCGESYKTIWKASMGK